MKDLVLCSTPREWKNAEDDEVDELDGE